MRVSLDWWKRIPAHRKFQVSSAVTLLLVFAVLFPLLAGVIKEYYVELNPQILADEVQSVAPALLKPEDFSIFQGSEAQQRFGILERRFTKNNLMKMLVWNRDGRVIYVENSSMIGQVFPENTRLSQALGGLTIIEVDPEGKNAQGTSYEQVMDVYVPIVFPQTNTTVGVVEIHQSIDTLSGILHATRQRLALFFFVSLLAIYVALNALYVEAQRSMEHALHELQMTNAKKNDFISIAAHELKTPITVIRGYAQMLMLKPQKIPKEVTEVHGILEHEAERLESQIDEMLDVSRIDLKTMNFVFEKTDVPAFLSERVKDFVPMMEKKRLRFHLAIAPDVASAVIDKDRVWQIILNLVVNAIKFSQEEKNISLSVRTEGELLVFSVKDEGPGIPKEFHTKIFERLYQVDPASTRKQGGLGLGLAICKGFVEGMGGTLRLESEPGQGTTFIFTIQRRV